MLITYVPILLVIEDEAVVRNLVIRVLHSGGYAAMGVGSSAESLALFEKEQGRFDLVFSDVVLPDQNGIATVELLQQKNPQLAVILCSGYTDERSRWHAIVEKKYCFLQKPCPAIELLAAVHKVLASRPQAPA